MAISTYKVFLMHKASNAETWEKLIDIKEFPDLGGDPEMLETTTLSDNMQTSIAGIQSADGLAFKANYDVDEYKKLRALMGKQEDYAVWFGGTGDPPNLVPTGDKGKFSFKGELTVFPNGGGVNEVVDMSITIAPSSVIAFDDGSAA